MTEYTPAKTGDYPSNANHYTMFYKDGRRTRKRIFWARFIFFYFSFLYFGWLVGWLPGEDVFIVGEAKRME